MYFYLRLRNIWADIPNIGLICLQNWVQDQPHDVTLKIRMFNNRSVKDLESQNLGEVVQRSINLDEDGKFSRQDDRKV